MISVRITESGLISALHSTYCYATLKSGSFRSSLSIYDNTAPSGAGTLMDEGIVAELAAEAWDSEVEGAKVRVPCRNGIYAVLTGVESGASAIIYRD